MLWDRIADRNPLRLSVRLDICALAKAEIACECDRKFDLVKQREAFRAHTEHQGKGKIMGI